MKVLYIEDNQMDADLTLKEMGRSAPDISFEVVTTIAAAEQKLSGPVTQYDLILTDLHLPDGDGLGFVEWVRNQSLPYALVMITGHGDEEVAVTALKSGVDDYISKNAGYLQKLPTILRDALDRFKAESARKTASLQVLYVEDNELDIDLTRRHFSRYAPQIHFDIFSEPREVIGMLSEPETSKRYDLILLDHRLQGFNALDVMKEIQPYRLNIPIILVTGHGDEEVAVQALKLGAVDYVVKNSDYLFHLPSILENAYNRVKLIQEQAALKESEERFRRLAENAKDMISVFAYQPKPHFEYISPASIEMLGYAPEELYKNPSLIFDLIHPDDLQLYKDFVQQKSPGNHTLEFRFINKQGKLIWADLRSVFLTSEDGELITRESIIRDVTERKNAEQHIQKQISRMSSMLMVDNAITASLDLKMTVDIVLDHVLTQLNVDAASVVLINQYSQSYKYFSGKGYNHDFSNGTRLAFGQGLLGKAILERKLISSTNPDDFQSLKNFTPVLIQEKFVCGFWVPLISKGVVKGVLEVFARKPIETDREWLDYLNMLATQTAIAVDNAELFTNLQRSNVELLQAYDSTLEGWVLAMDLRDKETEGHSQRVAEVTLRLAQRLGVRPEDMEHIRHGAILHDIGKMGVPDFILLKTGPLNDEEWKVMRKHPELAADMIKPISYLRKAVDIPLYHHERWDGQGYPSRLKGEDIPLAARIFAVVDVWDALISDRPYRKAWDEKRALDYIAEQSGIQFDPRVTSEFIALYQAGYLPHTNT